MNKMFGYVNELGRTPVIPFSGFPGLKFLGTSISQGDVRKIFGVLPECITVLHICGNRAYLLKEMAATGAEGLSLDTAVKLDEVVDKHPTRTFRPLWRPARQKYDANGMPGLLLMTGHLSLREIGYNGSVMPDCRK